MRGGIAALVFLAACAPAELAALSAPSHVQFGHCALLGGEKLPLASGGGPAICNEVERAIAAQAPTVRYSAEIRVMSPSRLAATLIVNGHTLPVQNFAVMDGKLSSSSIEHFASALARAVVEASRS